MQLPKFIFKCKLPFFVNETTFIIEPVCVINYSEKLVFSDEEDENGESRKGR